MTPDTIAPLIKQLATLQANDTTAVVQLMSEFKKLITDLEQKYSREEILVYISEIRKKAADSPFVKRAQTWPRGYQGDFETINHLISQTNKAAPNTLGYQIEDFFLQSAICKQHIYKVQKQAALINKTLQANSSAKIMSIGCGTSEDLRLNLAKIKESKAEITLVDVDRDALNYSQNALREVGEQVSIHQGNIYKLIARLQGKYDLILIGGVFDYLSDKAIVKILSSLKQNLNKKGVLFFTNIDQHNPYRVFMEYISDWILIERNVADIMRLIKQSTCGTLQVSVQKDETGLTNMVQLSNDDDQVVTG